jgi:hypothetical protein
MDDQLNTAPIEAPGHDTLAEFRPKGCAAPKLRHKPLAYRAFAVARDRPPIRLEMRTPDLCYAVNYTGMVITFDRQYSGAILTFPSLLAKLDGRHLRPIIEALIAGTCQYLEEFDPARWPEPEPGPVITHITIHTGKAGGDKG